MGLFRKRHIEKPDVEKSAGFMPLELQTHTSGTVEPNKLSEYGDFIDAYRQLPWLYAGATALAVAAPKPKLRVYREIDGEDEEIEGEEINRLLKRPNPFTSWREFIQIAVINMVITGNHYWNMVGTTENGVISEANPPVEMWWMKPENVEIVPDAVDFIKRYVYKQDGKAFNFDPSEVIHFKLVNPDSYFRGLGVLEPAKNTAIMEFNAVAYNKAFLENDATPFGVFHTPAKLTKEQQAQFLRNWNSMHRGSKRGGKLGFTYGDMEFKEIGTKPKDAQYIEMRKMNREEMLATIGVPPSVVGLLEYANYSNMEVQQKKFWEDAVIPILDLISDKMTLNLAPHFDENIYFKFDYSNIKALQEDEDRQSQIAMRLVSNGVMTPDEVRERFYSLEPMGGNAAKLFIPVFWIPMDQAGVKATPQQPAAAAPKKALSKSEDKVSFWQTPARKKAAWMNFEMRVKTNENTVHIQAESFLEKQAKRVSDKVGSASSVNSIKADSLINIKAETEEYSDLLKGIYYALFKEAGEAGMDMTEGKLYNPEMRMLKKEPDRFQMTPELEAKIAKLVKNSGTKINEVTLDRIIEMLAEAQVENWTVVEFQKNLLDKLTDLSRSRAMRIARTETGKVENWGQLEGYKQSEFIDKKGWMSAFAEGTRDSHKAADAKYSEQTIPLDEPFIVDGESLMYPGDPAGSAGNVINCLCTTYPEVGLPNA